MNRDLMLRAVLLLGNSVNQRVVGSNPTAPTIRSRTFGRSGAVLFRKKVGRARLLAFFPAQPPCDAAIEACAGAHHWGRELTRLGHTVR